MAPNRRPWPIRWILLLIVLFIVPYTYLNLRYRKPGPSYRPYQDSRERESVARAGYARITIGAERLADAGPGEGGAASAAVRGGLPEELRRSLIEPPLLPAEFGPVTAPASGDSSRPYPIQFECTVADDRLQLAGAVIYVRGADVVVVADFERLTGGLAARSRHSLVRLTIPPGALAKGRHLFTLVGTSASRSWSAQVH